LKKKLVAEGEEPPDTGGGRVFSLDATSGLMSTRWRLWRQSGSSALRSAFGVRVICHEGLTKNEKIPALDASSGLLATASASAPARFLALRSALVV